jgi:hypothetical protein
MKVLLGLVAWCSLAIAEFGPPIAVLPPTTLEIPGLPSYLIVGKLNCAARMWSPTKLQIWCTKLNVTVVNIVKEVEFVQYTFSYSDSLSDPAAAKIEWSFFMEESPVPWSATITVGTVVGPMLGGSLNVPM